MEEKDLAQALEVCNSYKSFAYVCEERVGLLEEAKKQSDAIIAEQEARVLTYRDEAEAERKKRNVLTPIGAALAGIALGFFYHQQQSN